ncbi:hypothetical protein OFO12_07335 [Campylobacter sp. JMF_04 NA10]|uniref:hypothetical protein n=1 Tax=Campylobacter sp. JMF_04 NA10 TaxID=2983824 RepID=UPI0022E99F3F|nr:hypothetical protein [Campylobacter sp. JMF_04 NA10]MDA3077167.1 hypothetical protein [Campylobacter sp. JMF_04 NA10]
MYRFFIAIFLSVNLLFSQIFFVSPIIKISTLNSNSITLTTSNIQADNINITTNSLNLISDKNTNSFTEFTNKSGILTATIKTKAKSQKPKFFKFIATNLKFKVSVVVKFQNFVQ